MNLRLINMRYLFVLVFIFIVNISHATDFIAVASGNWNASGVWSTDGFTPIMCGTCVAGVDYPGANDDAWTNGFNITVNSTQNVRDIMVEDVPGSLAFAGQLVVNGAMLGWSGGQFGSATEITTNVFSGNSVIRFTANDLSNQGEFWLFNNEVLGYWNNNAPIVQAIFNLSNDANIDTGFSNGSLRFTQFIIQAGNLGIGFNATDIEIASVIQLAANSSFNSSVGVHGIGGQSSLFNQCVVNNGAILTLSTANAFINANTFRLIGTGILENNFSGSNQTQGWWYQSAAPTTIDLSATSTVRYNANAAQNIVATTYGNLFINSPSSVVTKNLGSTGTLLVRGTLTINSANLTFNSNSNSANITLQGNLINNGTWNPSQLVIFAGSSAQNITGNNIVSFGGGIRVSNSAGLSLINIGTDVNGVFDVDPGAIFSPSDQVVSVSGNMAVDGTLSAGADPSGFIFDGTTSFLGSGSRSFNDFTVAASSSVNAPNNNINVAGDFTNNGTFNPTTGTVTLNGGQVQNISSTTSLNFENLTVTNGTAVVGVNSPINLEGIFTLGANSNFNAGGNLTLVSNATQTATVAPIPPSATITGNVIYQRYFDDAITARWRNIGLPIPGSTTDLTNAGFTVGGSLYSYNETVAGSVDFGWVAETGSLPDTKGYTLYMYDAVVPATLNVTGQLNTANVSLPVTYTDSDGSPGDVNDGWNLVNNPYAASIDWGSANWTKTNVNATCAVWNGLSYDYLTGAPGDLISSGQAFWVQTNGSNPSLIATQNVKSLSSTSFLKTTDPTENWMKVVLTDGENSDIAHIRFRTDATDEFDTKYDGYKKENTIFNFSSLTPGGKDLAVNTLPDSECERILPLKITNAEIGEHQLVFNDVSSLTVGYEIELIDNFLSNSIAVSEGTIYNFEITSDANSWGSERFELIFKAIGVEDEIEYAPEVENTCEDYVSITLPNTISGLNYTIQNDGEVISNSKTGTGGSLTLYVLKANLVEGTNQLDLQISGNSDCAQDLLKDNIIDFELIESPVVPEVAGNQFCGENTTVLNAQGNESTNLFRWYVSSGAVEPIEESATGEFTTPILSQSTTYYVSTVNALGCESDRVSVTATKVELLSPSIIETGFTCKEGPVTIEVSGAGDNEFYRWYENSESTEAIIETSSPLFNTPDITQTRNFYVTIANTDGCESEKVSVTVAIGELQTPTAISGTTCNEGSVKFDVAGAGDNEFYRWYNSATSTEPIAETSSSTFTSPVINQTTNFYVAIANTDGCESDRISVVAEVIELQKPTIEVQGLMLTASEASEYQWYRNGEKIEGAIQQSIIVDAEGEYSVEVFENTCSIFSENVTMRIASIDDDLFKAGLSLYPNPMLEVLHISDINGKETTKPVLYLYNNSGVLVKSHTDLIKSNRGGYYMNVESLSEGIYILNIYKNNGILAVRLLKK